MIVADGFAPKVRSADRARIRGVEVKSQTKLASWLQLTGALSYLDAKYQQVDPRAAPVTVNSALANTPEWTASAGLNVKPYKGSLGKLVLRSEEHTSELQSLMRTSYAVFCLKEHKNAHNQPHHLLNTNTK